MAQTPITVAGNLPKDDAYTGLDPLHDDLVNDTQRLRYAVIAFDCDGYKYKTDTGEKTPVIRIRRIEPATGDDQAEIEKLLDRLSEARLGALPLSSATDDGGTGDRDDEPEPGVA